jgi:hypothetical protein
VRDTPEHRLAFAVLLDALRIIDGQALYTGRALRVERAEALAWLTNRDGFTAAGCFSVNAVCDALCIDLAGLRRMVLGRAESIEVPWRRPEVGRLLTAHVNEMVPATISPR